MNVETVKSVIFGEIQKYLIDDISFAAPYLALSEEQQSIINSGAAVYNSAENRVVGILDGNETKGLNILKGDTRSAIIKLTVNDEKVIIRLLGGQSQTKLVNKDVNNLQFQYDIKLEAILAERHGNRSDINLKKLEPILEKEIKNIVNKTIHKSQKELNTDIFDLKTYLYGNHYKIWEDIRNDWEKGQNYFSNSTITLNVKANIVNQGHTIRSTEGRDKNQ